MRPQPEPAVSSATIEASAPGKVVVSGEYAVLAGAPALVAAVSRRVTCRLSARSRGGWHFASTGFDAEQALAKDAVFRAAPTTLAGIARRFVPAAAAPPHLHVAVDSSPCYLDGRKLGVGSSAATVVAVAAAFAALGGETPTLAALYDVHAEFQGGGSGLDVAAAVAGGVIRFQERRVALVRLPPGLHLVFVFAGASSSTRQLVGKFNAWRGGGTPRPLQRLADAAQDVADCTTNAESFVDSLGDYSLALERMDRSAGIGVFGPAHRRALAVAQRCGVAYKPCGAGGGDVGLCATTTAANAAAFARDAERSGLTVLPMEISPDGLDVRSHEPD